MNHAPLYRRCPTACFPAGRNARNTGIFRIGKNRFLCHYAAVTVVRPALIITQSNYSFYQSLIGGLLANCSLYLSFHQRLQNIATCEDAADMPPPFQRRGDTVTVEVRISMLPASTVLIFPPTDVHMPRNVRSVHLSSVYPRCCGPAFHQADIIPPSGVLAPWMARSWNRPNQCRNHLNWLLLMLQGRSSILNSLWMSEFLTRCLRGLRIGTRWSEQTERVGTAEGGVSAPSEFKYLGSLDNGKWSETIWG